MSLSRYGDVVALDDVTIDIPAGCMVGFIGPDGVGKSTLLSLLRRRAADSIRQRSRPRRDMGNAAHRAAICPRIAYMPQGLGKNLYADLSVRENIEFFRPPVRAIPLRTGRENQRASEQHRARALFRPPCEKTVWRHAAEARALLLPHP